MNAFQQRAEVVISNLRVRGLVPDPLAVRLRLTAMLNNEDWSPHELPPSAIICVRTLRDPLPRSVRLRQGDVRLPHAWRQAVVSSVEELVRHAARPALGAAPGESACVIFADQGELLACLALDWLEGRVLQRWWWGSLFKRGLGPSDVIWPAWRDAPEYVPTALQLLSDRGRAVEFARSLSPAQASRLLRSVTRRFALRRLEAAVNSGPEGDEPSESGSGFASDTSRTGAAGPAVHSPDGESAAPWHELVPESRDGGLSFEHQCFLGIALALRRAPGVVRRPDFALRVLSWRGALAGAERSPAVTPTVTGDAPRPVSKRQASNALRAREGSGPERGRRDAPPHDLDEKGSGPSLPHEPAPGRAAPGEERPTVVSRARSARPANTTDGPRADFTPPPERVHAPRPRDLEHGARSAHHPAAAGHEGPGEGLPGGEASSSEILARASAETFQTLDPAGERIATEYGWLFYFINLGLFLDLYGDFTSPNEPGIDLDIWDFVALLGLRVAGGQVRADPLWPLLARLAGRDDAEAPGRDFVPAEAWRVPADWLAPFEPGGVWRWSAGGGRLRVLHPEGFPVLALPPDETDPRSRLKVELQAYADCLGLAAGRNPSEAVEHDEAVAHDDVRAGPPPSTPTQRWADCLSSYVRARLRRAFGLDAGEDLSRILRQQPARVCVTATRVDVTFSLSQLPIEIRLSGLDRDPGWVPAAGRFISFHYD